MSFPNSNTIGAGIPTSLRPNSFPADCTSKVGNNHIASLKNITQPGGKFESLPGKSTIASGSSGLSRRTQHDAFGTKVRCVRGSSNNNSIRTENSNISSFDAHDAMVINDIFQSLETKSKFINKSEGQAMDFVRKEVSNEDFKNLVRVFSADDNESSAVDKANQIFTILNMLSEHSEKSGASEVYEIKKDVKFYVNNIIKHGLGIRSPFAGYLPGKADVLKAIDARLNKNAAQLSARKLNHNAAIERLVESKINTLQNKALKEKFLSNWKVDAFRPSKQTSDKMEDILNESRHFYSVDALLNHQPIKLELFKDFLQSNHIDQGNDTSNTGTPKPDNGVNKETPGPTYIYNDYSTTTNDNSIHFTDKSHLSMKEAANPPNGQEEKSPASANASATQRQNVTNLPERQSDRSTDVRGEGDGQKKLQTTETQTPPVTEGGHTRADDIDGPALPREASSPPDINAELNVRTSVQQVQPQTVGNTGSSTTAHQTSYIGPFTTGRTGAAQFQKYKQSSDSGRFEKKTASPITPSNDAGRGIKSDGVRSRDEHVSNPSPHVQAGENPVSDRGANQALHAVSFIRQRAQFATTSTKAKSNVAIVQSAEPRLQEGASPSLDPYIGPNRTGRTGAAEFKRYWQSAKKTIVETDTQAGRREPLPGRDEKELLTGSNTVGGENPAERDGSKANLKAHNAFETQPQKPAASPAQAMRQQQQLSGATGINKQQSYPYMGPHRTGRTGAADFKKYASDSNASTVSYVQNGHSAAERNAKPLVNAVPTNTRERRAVNQTGAAITATSGSEHAASATQDKVRVEPETSKVETTADVLLAATMPGISASRAPSLAKRHDAVSSGEKNTVTAAGNNVYKGPFWTGRQGATAKQSYINTDGFTKK